MRFALIALVVILVATLGTVCVESYDTWTHLAAGRWIVTHRAVPTTDPFSWTRAGAPWTDHEWLYQVGLWGVFAFGDVPALVLTKTTMLVGTFMLLLTTVYRRGAAGLTTATVAMAALASYPRFLVRPEVVSLLMLVAFIAVLEHVRTTRRTGWLWLLPGLQLLWANMHGYFVLGNLALSAYLAGEGLSQLRSLRAAVQEERYRPAMLKTLFWVWLSALAVTLLTPNFIEGATYPYRMLTSALSTDGIMIGELQSPLAVSWTTSAWCWTGLALAASAGLFARGRKVLVTDVLLVVMGLAASAAATRNVPYFAVVSAMVASRQLGGVWTDFQERRGLLLRRWWRYVVKPMLALPVAGLLVWQTWRAGTDRLYLDEGTTTRSGLHVDASRFSMKSLEFMRRNGLVADVFNDFADGGFLMWGLHPELRVAVDGRVELHGLTGLARYSAMVRDEQPLVDETGRPLRTVYLGLTGATTHVMIRRLIRDGEWKAAYADGACVIFVPATLDGKIPAVNWEELAGETVERLRVEEERVPGGRNIDWEFSNVATLLDLAGRPELSESVLRVMTQRYEWAASPWRQLGRVRLGQGQWTEAVQALDAARERDPDFPEVPRLLARAYTGMGKTQEAGRWLETARRESRFHPREMESVGDVYRDLKMWDQALGCYRDAGGWRRGATLGVKEVQVLAESGRLNEARELARKVVQRYPRDAAARRTQTTLESMGPR